jgi:hypothetical protein
MYGLKRFSVPAAVLGLVIGTATQSEADTNLVVNGGFEDAFTAWSWTTGTVFGSGIVPHSGFGDAALQSNSFYGDPSLSQAVTGLTVGDTYTLSFYYLNSFNNVGNELQVRFGGTPVYQVIDPHTGYLTAANYVEETLTVTATSMTEKLEFDAHTNLGYFRLDDVSLTANAAVPTPEPSTMIPAAIASLLGLGYAWRRRKARREKSGDIALRDGRAAC